MQVQLVTHATIPTIPQGDLQPGQYYLLANNSSNGYSGSTTPDQTYTSEITDDGGIALVNGNLQLLTQLDYSLGSAYVEGTPLSPSSGFI